MSRDERASPGGEIVVYEAADGEVRVDVRLESESVWLSLTQIAELFKRDKSVISRHLRNVFTSEELEREGVVARNATTAADGKTCQIEFFNLDAILSVGYRVNSKRGTQFRIWATTTLREHLLRGYTLHERRLRERGLGEIEQAVGLMARTLTAHAPVTDEGRAVLEVVQGYTRAWRWLLEYDEERLAEAPQRPVSPSARLSLEEARAPPRSCRKTSPPAARQARFSLKSAATAWRESSENGKDRLLRAVRELSQAFALAVPHSEALRIRDDVAFFQAVRAVLAKRAPGDGRQEEELDHAVRQIISRAVAPEGVVDIFAAAGLDKPDISILSEEFLAEMRDMPQRNLAVELLQKLLKVELRARRRKNVVQARSFAEMLERSLLRYQNRAVEAAQVIEELIGLARQMREADRRGEDLGLTEDELAFYDALEINDSAVAVLGDETLRGIARELVESVRNNVTIDWTLRENVRAKLRVIVKRILRKHGYPPDKQERATQTVLEQAEVLSQEWAAA